MVLQDWRDAMQEWLTTLIFGLKPLAGWSFSMLINVPILTAVDFIQCFKRSGFFVANAGMGNQQHTAQHKRFHS